MVVRVRGISFKRDEIEPLIESGITFGELKKYISSAVVARSSKNGIYINPGTISSVIDRLNLRESWNSKTELREKRKLKIRVKEKEKRKNKLENNNLEFQRKSILSRLELETFRKFDAHPLARKFTLDYFERKYNHTHYGGARYSLDKLLIFFDWVWRYYDEKGKLPTYTQAAEYGNKINLGRGSFYPSSVGKIFLELGLQTTFSRHFSRQLKQIRSEVLKFKNSFFDERDVARYLGISHDIVKRIFRAENRNRDNKRIIKKEFNYIFLLSHASEVYLLLDHRIKKNDIMDYMRDSYNHPKEIIEYVIENRKNGEGLEKKIKKELKEVLQDRSINKPYIESTSPWLV